MLDRLSVCIRLLKCFFIRLFFRPFKRSILDLAASHFIYLFTYLFITGTFLEGAAKKKSEGTNTDLLNQLPLADESMTVIRYDRSTGDWRGQCLRIVVGILTAVAGLGTISSIAYLLIKFLILA